jgi:hypothetical protein
VRAARSRAEQGRPTAAAAAARQGRVATDQEPQRGKASAGCLQRLGAPLIGHLVPILHKKWDIWSLLANVRMLRVREDVADTNAPGLPSPEAVRI